MQLCVLHCLRLAIIKLQIFNLLKFILLMVMHITLPTAITYLLLTARQHNPLY